eukprot:6553356-Alexandrium_andersonii.AAC.1
MPRTTASMPLTFLSGAHCRRRGRSELGGGDKKSDAARSLCLCGWTGAWAARLAGWVGEWEGGWLANWLAG